MLRSLFGPNTVSAQLRGGLEETSATHRGIGGRVARALEASSSTEFAGALDAETAKLRQVELEQDMVALADTQLRYEAEARLLSEAYQRLRVAMRDRG